MKWFEKKVCFVTGETLGIGLVIAERFGQEPREYENSLRWNLIYNYSNIQFLFGNKYIGYRQYSSRIFQF